MPVITIIASGTSSILAVETRRSFFFPHGHLPIVLAFCLPAEFPLRARLLVLCLPLSLGTCVRTSVSITSKMSLLSPMICNLRLFLYQLSRITQVLLYLENAPSQRSSGFGLFEYVIYHRSLSLVAHRLL